MSDPESPEALPRLRQLVKDIEAKYDFFDEKLPLTQCVEWEELKSLLSAGGSAPLPPDVQQLFRDHSVALEFLRELATWDCRCGTCLVCRAKAWLFTEQAGGSAPLPLCCGEPTPDRSGRTCDKPKGHQGPHWTYGGNEMTWDAAGGSAPRVEPLTHGVWTLDELRCCRSVADLRADIIRSAARGQGPTFIAAKLDYLLELAALPLPSGGGQQP